MLRALLDRLTANSLPVASSSAAAAADSSKPATTRLPNEDRLEQMGYKIEYPRCFEDPILHIMMDNPVMLNNCPAQILDLSSLALCSKEGYEGSFVNPYTRAIDYDGALDASKSGIKKRETYKPYTELKSHIDHFVAGLECLHHSIKQLDDLLKPIAHVADLFANQSQCLVKIYTKEIEEEKLSRVQAICDAKLAIIEHARTFIEKTKITLQSIEDKKEKESTENRLLNGASLLIQLLEAEINYVLTADNTNKYALAIQKQTDYTKLIFEPLTEKLIADVSAQIAHLTDEVTLLDIQFPQKPALPPSPVTTSQQVTIPLAASEAPAARPRHSFLRPGLFTPAFDPRFTHRQMPLLITDRPSNLESHHEGQEARRSPSPRPSVDD